MSATASPTQSLSGGAVSIISIVSKNGPTGFGYSSTAEEVTAGLSLAGKTILVTGCNSGLGHETLRVLSLRGAQVVGTARTLSKAEAACQGMQGKPIPLECELSDPKSIRNCIASLKQQGKQQGLKLDAIICN